MGKENDTVKLWHKIAKPIVVVAISPLLIIGAILLLFFFLCQGDMVDRWIEEYKRTVVL